MAEAEGEFDLVVAGSGGAGMVAALTAAHHGLSAIVLEKAGSYGGSTARSGGGLWLPGNEVLRRAGVRDSAEEARAYLAHVAGAEVTAARQHAFLAAGPAMLALVRAHTPLDFAWVPGYPDYHPEAPGGRPGGRSIEPRPLDARLAGPDLATLARPYRAAPKGIAVTQVDFRWLSLGTRHPRAFLTVARLAARALTRRKLTMGQALAAGLRAGLRTAGVDVRLGTPMTDLLVEHGRVAGVRAGGLTFRARRGVLLASGGFEHNEPMRRKYQDLGVEWTAGASGNTGDGIEAGERLGAALDLMDEAWWGPSIPLPGGPYFCLAERNQPGCLLVDSSGRRFVNEAAPYVDAVHAMLAPGVQLPAWLVADQTYRNRYLFAGHGPRARLPRRWFAAGIAHRADTLDELAGRIGVPAYALRSTVRRFNGFAAHGHDDDFGRGDSAYDRYYGDPRQRPNPCLGALARPPFYAFRMVPGDLGTKGGLRTDERARVLRPDGTAIPGLYAAGNAGAAVMGRGYAGAGATLGPALTFGYLAALDCTTPAGPQGCLNHDQGPLETS
ncbi:3-oxosteroid 1-dehydrogenase [Actinoplanes awajinensis]|uniref:3-oxosteroid 1-dehydrogenase n=1 Tax=Actinoplanes awajinensis subsp. mycoplanecinus TaxID=135947 RepID=A0A0X3V9N6_9ACTN|nr:3-oxosteroid 1-dehydrogenase [Actinoplanes awajinensis]KUL41491.1 3-ketosteroid-delta-1-dehydrogenase [Actinoplanes awajinensis subsp. mycoplanecinus]